MNQADFEHLILAWLQEKGYKEAQQALERSIRVNDPDEKMALTDRLSVHKGVVEHLIENFAVADQPAAYKEALDRFSNWVDNSLDLYKVELSRVLYPLLVHSYLNLLEKDAPVQARHLMETYKKRVLQVEPGLARTRAVELRELETVASKRQQRRTRYTVCLTPYAHGLLMHFLHTAPGMLCLSSIVNQYVTLEVTDKAQAEEADQGKMDGDEMASGEALTINSQPVRLGLLKGNIEDKYAEAEEQRLQEEQKAANADKAGGGDKAADESAKPATGAAASKPDKEAEAGPAAKKTKKADTSKSGGTGGTGEGSAAAGQPAHASRTHPGERIDPSPWTPQLSDPVTKSWLEDVQHRADVSKTSLPSCCFFTFANTRQALNCAAFTTDTHYLAAGFADSSVRLYDLPRLAGVASSSSSRAAAVAGIKANGEGKDSQPGAMDIDDEPSQPGVSYLYGHLGPVHAVDFSHDTRMLLSGSADGSVRLWSTELATALTCFKGHVMPVWDVASGPLGYHFVSASADRTARIWATDAVKMLRLLSGHQSDVDVVRWHPNCHYVATASSDRSVRLWDVATGNCVRFMSGLQSAPTSMAMHPDGQHIAVGCERGTIHVWDLSSGRRLTSYKAHAGAVWSLAYSQGQGAVLASGGADETVRVWSVDQAVAAASDARPAHTKYTAVVTSHTKSSSVTHVQFSHRNLLLAAGAFNLRTARKQA